MSILDKLHDQAMEAAFLADLERRKGNEKDAAKLFEKALDLERQAIAEMTTPVEPTWSILHRSAGWLALDCNRPRQAEQLACIALTGDPPPEIADELRDLLEQANSRRHLELKGLALQDDELQFSLSGREIGSGVAKWGEVYKRISSLLKLVYRIVEWKQNRPFRKRGPLPKEIRENYQLLISVPRSGSFAVTLKFGSLAEQRSPGTLDTRAIIGEFMDLIEMVNRSHISEIQERVPDPAYLRNFFDLAEKIAPDGERVRQVGFTAIGSGTERSVELTLPTVDFPVPAIVDRLPLLPADRVSEVEAESAVELLSDTKAELIEIRGVLRYTDAFEKNVIKIVDAGITQDVEVPEGRMDAIVGSMWNSRVVISATRTGSTITLRDIRPDDQD